MIERLLAAEAALADGDVDHAQRLFRQVADADPRNAIAVVGLADVARRRGETADAIGLVEAALAIDPDDAAAHRLLDELRPSIPAPTTRAPTAPESVGATPTGATRSILGWLRRLLGRRS
jgi:thioredoxin-like negative regulator of GroEL